jgi:hypothetical protein
VPGALGNSSYVLGQSFTGSYAGVESCYTKDPTFSSVDDRAFRFIEGMVYSWNQAFAGGFNARIHAMHPDASLGNCLKADPAAHNTLVIDPSIFDDPAERAPPAKTSKGRSD